MSRSLNSLHVNHLLSIDALRGVAALMIVLYHLVELAQLPIPSELSVIRTHFGKGVPLFFALSGFVLSFGYSDKIALGRDQVLMFYIKRFFRIAPMFYFVLIGWRVFGHFLWNWSDPLLTIFLNVTFLFGLVPDYYDSLVMAGWSIGVEMLFYLIFPALIVLLNGRIATIFAFIISCVISSAVWKSFHNAGLDSYAYMNLLTQLPFFLIGVLAYRIWSARGFERGKVGIYCLLTATIIAYITSTTYFNLYKNMLEILALDRNIWALVFGLLIYGCCTVTIPLLNNGPLVWFSRRSYSAYLLHVLVLVFLIKQDIIPWLSAFGLWQGFVMGTMITLLALSLISNFTYLYIELPGVSFGDMLINKYKNLLTKSTNSGNYLIPRETKNPKKMIQDEPANFAMYEKRSNFNIFISNYLSNLVRFKSIANHVYWAYLLYLITALVFVFSLYVTARYINQPLVDVHAFRQSQTALTSFWMLKDGIAIPYLTPVVGYPWSIPFEFPIYQGIVAAIAYFTGVQLEAVGRFVSYVFMIACAWPVFSIAKRFDLPKSVPLVFCILMWSSPLYIYWGRSFMIETTALFFLLACFPYAIDIILQTAGTRSRFFYVFFATAGVLQKSTTILPFIFAIVVFDLIKNFRPKNFDYSKLWSNLVAITIIMLPLAIGIAWVHYTDLVKMENPFGTQLTSNALNTFNFGTLNQKLDPETYRLVVWERSFGWNAASWLGVSLLVLPWFGNIKYRNFAWMSMYGFILYLIPILIFTNLHFVHEYYQVACVAFLIGALAIIIGGWIPKVTGMQMLVPIIAGLIVLSNFVFFSKYYGIVAARNLDESDPRSVQSFKVGRFLRENTPENTGLVIFGQGYSSEISFQAQRKSMTADSRFVNYQDVWYNPQKYLGDTKLSALVICPSPDSFPVIKGFPDVEDLSIRLKNEQGWERRNIEGCEILIANNVE